MGAADRALIWRIQLSRVKNDINYFYCTQKSQINERQFGKKSSFWVVWGGKAAPNSLNCPIFWVSARVTRVIPIEACPVV